MIFTVKDIVAIQKVLKRDSIVCKAELMAALGDGAVPKNNLEKHLARYKSGNKENPGSIATISQPRKSVFALTL